jgi:hypothetical protein
MVPNQQNPGRGEVQFAETKSVAEQSCLLKYRQSSSEGQMCRHPDNDAPLCLTWSDTFTGQFVLTRHVGGRTPTSRVPRR